MSRKNPMPNAEKSEIAKIRTQNTADTPIKRGRQFARGISGNPKGRPKGSRNRSTAVLEKLGAKADEVWDVIIKLASEGDHQALRIMADRTAARLREPACAFDLPPIVSLNDIPKASHAIVTACRTGQLPLSAAETLMRIIDRQRANLMLAAGDSKQSTEPDLQSDNIVCTNNERFVEAIDRALAGTRFDPRRKS